MPIGRPGADGAVSAPIAVKQAEAGATALLDATSFSPPRAEGQPGAAAFAEQPVAAAVAAALDAVAAAVVELGAAVCDRTVSATNKQRCKLNKTMDEFRDPTLAAKARTSRGWGAQFYRPWVGNAGGDSIGIGGRVASPPLPHHRTSGSASGGSED